MGPQDDAVLRFTTDTEEDMQRVEKLLEETGHGKEFNEGNVVDDGYQQEFQYKDRESIINVMDRDWIVIDDDKLWNKINNNWSDERFQEFDVIKTPDVDGVGGVIALNNDNPSETYKLISELDLPNDGY